MSEVQEVHEMYVWYWNYVWYWWKIPSKETDNDETDLTWSYSLKTVLINLFVIHEPFKQKVLKKIMG